MEEVQLELMGAVFEVCVGVGGLIGGNNQGEEAVK